MAFSCLLIYVSLSSLSLFCLCKITARDALGACGRGVVGRWLVVYADILDIH